MQDPGAGPGTVLPPRPGSGQRRIPSEYYDRAAEPVLAFADELARLRGGDTAAVLREAVTALDAFSESLRRAGAIASTIPPARYALALIIDQKARANRRLDPQAWSAGATRHLFDGRDISAATLRDFIRRAAEAGHDFAPVRAFLERCQARLDSGRTTLDTDTGMNWTGITVVLILAFLLLVAGWATRVEWQYHARLTRVFDAEAATLTAAALAAAAPAADAAAEGGAGAGAAPAGGTAALAAALDRLKADAEGVAAQAEKAPIRLGAGLIGFDAAAHAGDTYRAAVAALLPGAIAAAIADVMASEGDPVVLYDAVRAWSVLSGQAAWSPGYLAGWLSARGAADPALAALAPHALALGPPDPPPAFPDPELLEQAIAFAAEAPEDDRAFLELLRSDGAAALPPWIPDAAVPGLGEALVRRSGLAIGTPVPGLFTQAGWDYARDFGAGLAVQSARQEAARLWPGLGLEEAIDAPDRVMDRLQASTIATWSAFLADLRVRPFQNPDAAVRVSGLLALTDSPLVMLLKEVWVQAGGTDRRRAHEQQLRIAAEFGAMIQYVEQGRMAQISALFASLNVALGAMDRDEEAGLQRLMSVQDRAASITALRQAPVVVVQIVEDALAQTAASHADLLTNPLTKAWQVEVLSACRAAAEGRFPFVPDGPDADLGAVLGLLAPGGALDRFLAGRAEPYLDTTVSPWRWKPEARFEGLSPDSAAFFERARAIRDSLGAAGGGGSEMTLAALAERGRAFIAVGGQGGPVTTDAADLRLSWPGADPAAGAEISFESPEGAARVTEPGQWGFFRLLAPFKVRQRDGGQRFLVDVRTGGSRLFLEISFASAANPLAAFRLMKGLACPQVL